MNVKQGSQQVSVLIETTIAGWLKSKGAVVLCAWVVALASARGTILISDNFDSQIAGTTPAGWVSSNALINNTQSVSAPNSLAIVDPGYAYQNLPAPISLTSNEQITVTYDFRSSVLSDLSLNRFLLFNDVPNHYGALGSVWFYNGAITTKSGSGATTVSLGSYSANTWYHVTLSFTPSDGFFDVAVMQGLSTIGSANGVSFDLGSNPNLDANPVFDAVSMSNEFSVGTATSFFDNVMVESVPEPSSILMCVVGGLAFLFARRTKVRLA